jgi:hypothetical protein
MNLVVVLLLALSFSLRCSAENPDIVWTVRHGCLDFRAMFILFM